MSSDSLGSPADPGLSETEAVSGGPTPRREAGIDIAPGHALGRYTVLSRLAAGGMGVVFAAYDPELDRKVAVKLVRADDSRGSEASEGRRRLVREAQAMARLNHRNVITVHDVGVHDGAVFVAMEFIDGRTLADVIETGDLAWRSMLELFLAAGEGLSAAHAAGLIHRDFKPENVMVDQNGRVCVLDFGLARADCDDLSTGSRDSPPPSAKPSDPWLTQTGAVLGTPRYMSPEQHFGLKVDARSDQFSFCVALYEGIYGERPFPGETLAQIVGKIASGESPVRPRVAGVPIALHQVIARGLSSDPDRRFPTMEALISSMRAIVVPRRRGVWFGTALAAVAAASGFAVWSQQARPDACRLVLDRAESVWNDEAREAVSGAFEEIGTYAVPASAAAVAGLDGYVARWTEQRHSLCLAGGIDGADSNIAVARDVCLEGSFAAVETVVEALRSPTPSVVESALDAVIELPPLERCSDVAYLSASVPPPDDPELADRVAGLRRRLAGAKIQNELGEFQMAHDTAQSVHDDPAAAAYPPVRAEALVVRGRAQDSLGDARGAAGSLEEAFFLARAKGHESLAMRAAIELAFFHAESERDLAQAQSWARHASADAVRIGGPADRAAIAQALGTVFLYAGDAESSRKQLDEALELYAEHYGPNHPRVAAVYNSLGVLDRDADLFDAAIANHRRAIEIWTGAVGPDHPDVAVGRHNVAVVLRRQGKLEEAEREMLAAMRVFQRVSPDHPNFAAALGNLGNLAEVRGDIDRALNYQAQALAVLERTVGPEHPRVADPLNNLGRLTYAKGDLPKALRLMSRALSMRRASSNHPVLLGFALADVAAIEFELDRSEAALQHAREALTYLDPSAGTQRGTVGSTHFVVARLLARDDPDRAWDHATKARDVLTTAGDGGKADLEQVERWLERRPPSPSPDPRKVAPTETTQSG